jgi:hypothetical protein
MSYAVRLVARGASRCVCGHTWDQHERAGEGSALRFPCTRDCPCVRFELPTCTARGCGRKVPDSERNCSLCWMCCVLEGHLEKGC